MRATRNCRATGVHERALGCRRAHKPNKSRFPKNPPYRPPNNNTSKNSPRSRVFLKNIRHIVPLSHSDGCILQHPYDVSFHTCILYSIRSHPPPINILEYPTIFYSHSPLSWTRP